MDQNLKRAVTLEMIEDIKESLKTLESKLINKDFMAARSEAVLTTQERLEELILELMEIE